MGVELNYLYLCLDRFAKSADESKDPIDRFMYSLKNIYELEVHRNMTTKNDILVALAEAREDARERALAEGKAEVAKAMLEKNSPIDFIASVTGLTEEQVKNLQ